MFDRFSDRARRVVALAEVEAHGLGHGHLGTEHLLLGLLAEGHSPAAAALVAAGANLDAGRQKAAEAVGRDKPATVAGDLPLTARGKRALERASRFSLQRRDPYVEAQHILLGVLDVEGTAGQVLRGLGVDVGALHDTVSTPVDAAAAEPHSAAPEAGPETAPSPQCAECGAPLEATLAWKVLPARGESPPDRDVVITFCSRCGSALGAAPA